MKNARYIGFIAYADTKVGNVPTNSLHYYKEANFAGQEKRHSDNAKETMNDIITDSNRKLKLCDYIPDSGGCLSCETKQDTRLLFWGNACQKGSARITNKLTDLSIDNSGNINYKVTINKKADAEAIKGQKIKLRIVVNYDDPFSPSQNKQIKDIGPVIFDFDNEYISKMSA